MKGGQNEDHTCKKQHRTGKFLPGAVCSSLFISPYGARLGAAVNDRKSGQLFRGE